MLVFPGGSTLAAQVSWADEQDDAALVAIYNHYVKHSAATFDHDTLNVSSWRARINADHYPLLVYSDGGQVRGFAYGSPFRAKAGYRWTAEVTVYVAPDAQGKGIGTALYLDVLRLLRAQGYVTVAAVITLPAPASIALHKSFGFIEGGRMPAAGYKLGGWHELSFMHLSLAEPASDQPLWPPMTITALRAQPVQVVEEAPNHPDIELFIRTLDDFHDHLYPPEQNYHESSATLTESDATVFVARMGRMAVGMAALKPFADYGELKRMYVSGLFRGKGVARTLLQAVEGEARARGLSALKLETGPKQTPAIQLYKSQGFSFCQAFGDYEGHESSVFMTKPLL